MRIYKFTIAFLFLLLFFAKASSAAIPEYAKPIRVYQAKYDMSFFVWRPLGLQSKWFATYDGYPVTEIARNQWVYGVIGNAGQLTESIITVGSVAPNTVHILRPLPLSIDNKRLFKSDKTDSLKEIFNTKCDNFGIAYTNASFTPIAWKSGASKVYMWGGKKWVPIFQQRGERLADAIKRNSNIVADMLRKNKIIWTQIDTHEFANYIRSAGYTWIDNFETNMPVAFSEINIGGGDGHMEGTGQPGGIGGGGGGWDTGRD